MGLQRGRDRPHFIKADAEALVAVCVIRIGSVSLGTLPAFLGLPSVPMHLAPKEGPTEPETVELSFSCPAQKTRGTAVPDTPPRSEVIPLGKDLENRGASEAGRV